MIERNVLFTSKHRLTFIHLFAFYHFGDLWQMAIGGRKISYIPSNVAFLRQKSPNIGIQENTLHSLEMFLVFILAISGCFIHSSHGKRLEILIKTIIKSKISNFSRLRAAATTIPFLRSVDILIGWDAARHGQQQ